MDTISCQNSQLPKLGPDVAFNGGIEVVAKPTDRKPAATRPVGRYKKFTTALVEDNIALPNPSRRSARNWENVNRLAFAFLRLASIRLMLKLSNSASEFRVSSMV